MNTDAVSAAIVSPRPAWGSLLWMVPFTVLWTRMIYSLPVLPESGLPALALRLMVHGLMALGLWLGLEGTDLTPDHAARPGQLSWSRSRFGPLSPGPRPSMVFSVRAPPPYRCCHRRSSCR